MRAINASDAITIVSTIFVVYLLITGEFNGVRKIVIISNLY